MRATSRDALAHALNRRLALARVLADAVEQRAGVVCERVPVFGAQGDELRDQALVAVPGDRRSAEQPGVATLLADLAREPVEVLERLVVRGQHVRGVLDRERPERVQAPHHLGPEVAGLGRDLVQQQQPLERLAHVRAVTSASFGAANGSASSCESDRTCAGSTSSSPYTTESARSVGVNVPSTRS